ncbi:tetratricopeptide repeat protein [Streptomyces microflavus]|uniref:tetratricopeptide repeat protein n=1 Tax=Streptomyces microflavus TaxID=1919 RepID=UPI00224CCE08|nr:tetratricopeptide repeat protein [Streptomyces microflavus]MCX4657272.1 tetratricopeptide repeat protein [Streptomyces microflavus]
MTKDVAGAPGRPASSAGHYGADGAIVAGGNVTSSSTHYTKAEQAFVLPAEAYAPIPDDATADGVSNIGDGLFVGRLRELAVLEEAFARPGAVVVHALHGLGGVGKSALAAHWAARRQEKLRWWVTADTADSLAAGIAALARALQPGLTGLPTELQFERAVAWLAGHDGWLLVLDNVEDAGHIRPLLDRVPGGRVLITTRRATGWHHQATTIHLGVLKPSDALDLFTRVLTHAGPRDTSGAETLCEELGHLALAVEQASAYCAETGTSPRGYLGMLAQWPAAMFAAGTQGGDAERTIARVWHLTLDRLADTPLAGTLLRTLAWYAPENIPRDLLTDLAEPPQLATALGRLIAYNMITDNHDGTLTIHRLVQSLARLPEPTDPHRLPDAVDQARDQAAALLAHAFPASIEHPESWPRCRALLPHINALTRNHTSNHDTIHTADALGSAAHYQARQGAVALAVQAMQRVLAAHERVLGTDHPDTLIARSNLASAYLLAGDLARAISLFEDTLAARERALGTDHPDTLIARSNLASAYLLAGDLARAISLFEGTLAARERALGTDHPDTLTSRNNLAHAYEKAGNLARAIPLFEGTLADSERVLGTDHPETLTSRSNLVSAQRVGWDPARVILTYEGTLAARERVLGADHPDTLTSRNNLASAYERAGNLARAIPLFEGTLADCERVLGTDHPDTLASRNNLASAYEKAGDLGRAISMHEGTLAARQRVLGTDHPDTLTSRNNLAHAYEKAGDPARAIPMHEGTLADCERVLGTDHPLTLTSRNNLAYTYMRAGDPSRATPMYEEILAIRKRVLSTDHPDTLTSRLSLAYTYVVAGDPGRAIPLYKDLLADGERVLGADHLLTLSSRYGLACSYERVADVARAIPMYEDFLADNERVLGADDPLIKSSRYNLASAYEKAGDPARAIPLYQDVVASSERVLGTDHPDTLSSRFDLASAYEKAGDLARAIPMYKDLLADNERLLNTRSPDDHSGDGKPGTGAVQ